MSHWSAKDIQTLIDLYPVETARAIGKKIGRTRSAIKGMALKLGLRKSTNNGCFKKGHISFNKGKKQSEYMSKEAIEKTKATRFKKGHTPHNHKPVGSIRIDSKDGYYLIKTKEPSIYEHLHRVIWEMHNPKEVINEDEIIWFKDGNKANISISNLEKITRLESAKRMLNSDGGIAKLIEYDKEKRK